MTQRRSRLRYMWYLLGGVVLVLALLGGVLLAAGLGANTLWPLIRSIAEPAQAVEQSAPFTVAGFSLRSLLRWLFLGFIVLAFVLASWRDLASGWRGIFPRRAANRRLRKTRP